MRMLSLWRVEAAHLINKVMHMAISMQYNKLFEMTILEKLLKVTEFHRWKVSNNTQLVGFNDKIDAQLKYLWFGNIYICMYVYVCARSCTCTHTRNLHVYQFLKAKWSKDHSCTYTLIIALIKFAHPPHGRHHLQLLHGVIDTNRSNIHPKKRRYH